MFGLAPGCLGGSAWTAPELVAAMPASVTFSAAASLPTVCTTALMALECMPATGPGSKVWSEGSYAPGTALVLAPFCVQGAHGDQA